MKFAFVLLLLAPMSGEERLTPPDPLVTHEWGTFTSVASEDGSAIKWNPYSGPVDLPCFVNRLGVNSPKRLGFGGFVRMETPVLYFYSQRAVSLSVRVDFPQGWITEWYPRATKPPTVQAPSETYRDGRIEWSSVEVLPGENPELPTGMNSSHYYAARATDSAPLRVGNQWEKLLFYRGIGDFEVPLKPAFTREGRFKIRNAGSETIPLAILFENRGGKLGYRITRSLQKVVELDLPELNGSLEELHQYLANQLVEFGLYRKEALAMIETWKDSWFEEGMRVFYIVPRSQVDTVLPLQVNPMPSAIARVFVGRVEVLSPALRQTIETALTSGNVGSLKKYDRFLDPFVAQIERTSGRYVNSLSKLLPPRFYDANACVR